MNKFFKITIKNLIVQTAILLFFQILAGSAKPSKKIHNGQPTNSDEFEFLVSIRYQKFHICSGSIITTTHVLTAASCVLSEPHVAYANLEILSGTKDLMDESFGNIHEVSHVAFHEYYAPQHCWRNDIAILKTTSIFIFNRFRQKATMTFYSYTPKSLIVAGWGGLNGNLYRYLNKIGILSLMSGSKCRTAFRAFDFVHHTQLCGAPTDFQAVVTEGDGGGSVISSSNEIILAIVSVIPLTSFGFPMISTLIYPYLDFINDITARL